jgi:outer membrane lipoprotein LolB
MLHLLWLAVVLSIAGCATAPTAVHVQELNPTVAKAFVLDGRIAMRYQSNATSANLHWVHSPFLDEVALSSPLGSTVAVLTRDANGVRVVDSEQHSYQGQDVAELTERLLGARIPLDYLAYWVLGQAVPNMQYQTVKNSTATLVSLRQAGWVINYQRWQQSEEYSLPDKLSIVGEGGELRMVITRWNINGEGV